MGTTQDAIRTGHPQLGFVLVIEGYKYLITTGTPSQATTAWSGTLWSDALPGLQIEGAFSQSLKPWSNELDVPSISFRVLPDSTDQFGKDMFKIKPSVRSELTASFDTSDSTGAFNITVKDADQFSTGTPVYVGTNAFNITGTPSGLNIPVPANGFGYYSPFGTNTGSANRFPNAHSIRPEAHIEDHQVNAPVYVTDSPPTWVGKKVGLFVHRIVDGVWDVKAQAEVWFAGTIQSVEEAEDGATVLHCADIRKALQDTVMMSKQFVANVAEGFYFDTGTTIKVYIRASTGAGGAQNYKAADFVAGTDFTAGRYTADEFGDLLSEHLNTDATIGRSGSSLGVYWSVGVASTINGPRFRIHADLSGTNADSLRIMFTASDGDVVTFLGYEPDKVLEGTGAALVKGPESDAGDTATLTASDAPFIVPPVGLSIGVQKPLRLDLEDSQGTFWDHTNLLPRPAQFHVTGSEKWSYFLYGDQGLFLARYDSATQLSGIAATTGIAGELSGTPRKFEGIRQGEKNGVKVRQVAFLCDSFASLMVQLFASIDGNAINHATYDTLPDGNGAGIPWDLLGQGFVDSLLDIEASTEDEACAIIVERPMRLWDVIKSELALRMAGVVWKDGGLQIVQFTVPNASTADHTLTEANKSDTRRMITRQTDEYLCHTIKIQHNRRPGGDDDYLEEIVIRDAVGYEQLGAAGSVKTIKARNAFGISSEIGASVESLADTLASRFLPVFARPLKMWQRSISHQHFHIAPADTVAVTDLYARDPNTGARGLSSRAATVVSVSHAFGIDSNGQGYFGSVELLFTEEDRVFPLAPAAEHANVTGGSYTNGWDAAGSGLLVHQHKFSTTAESNDSTHFVAGDAIRITELDPDDVGSGGADSFTDTIASITEDAATISSVDYDEIELTNGFGGANPAFNSAKTYVVTYDAYDQVDATGKLHTFQADDSDGQILDLIDPNILGDPNQSTYESADLTLLPYRHAAIMYGDGEPVGSNTVRHLCRVVNNLNNYKTATCAPVLNDAFAAIGGGFSGEGRRAIWTMPFYIGRSAWPAGYVRKLNISVWMNSNTGGQAAQLYVVTSENPPSDDNFLDPSYSGPSAELTFASSSTSNALTAVQQIVPIRSKNWTDFTWITVEVSENAGGYSSQFSGIGELWLGPLEAA